MIWKERLTCLVVAVRALRTSLSSSDRRGYQVVLWSNAVYVVVVGVHFAQHLNHQEVDWAHLLLVVTNIGSIIGVLMVTLCETNGDDGWRAHD